MLTQIQRERWQAYERAEGRAGREEKLRALNVFLDSLDDSDVSEWFPWARSIAEQVVDHGLDLVIRQPLFERALFPALLAGYRAQMPGCARWLAGLAENLQRSSRYRQAFDEGGAAPLALLRAALEHDPEDRWALMRLIETIASRLRYAVHELPAGVLYGIDGASPDQCLELEAELNEFCELVARAQQAECYAELIATCRLHFAAYRDYLLNRERYSSYAGYLGRHDGTRS